MVSLQRKRSLALAVLALALIAAVGFVLVRDFGTDAADPIVVSNGNAAPAAADAAPNRASERTAVGPDLVQGERDSVTDAPSEPAHLHVQVLFDDGMPAAGLGVLAVEPRAGRGARQHRAETGPDGRALFAGLAPTRHVVDVRGTAAQEIALVAGTTAELVFTVARGIGIEGRVVDAFGAPVVGATLWLTPSGHEVDHRGAAPVGASQAEGRFAVEGVALPVTTWIAARAPGHSPSPWRFVVALEAADVPVTLREVELRLGHGPATLVGGCLDGDGRPVAGADVRLAPVGIASEHDGDARLWPGHEYDARTGSDGRFRFDELAVGTWTVSARADGLWFEPREVVISQPFETIEILLTALLAARITGRVADPAQQPIADALVGVRGVDGAHVTSDAVGAFALADLPPRPVELFADAEGFEDVERALELHPGDNGLDIVMRRRPRLFGTACNARGQPLAGWRIGAIQVDSDRWGGAETIAADGSFELFVADSQPRHLWISHRDAPFPTVLRGAGTFLPSDEPIELTVQDNALASAAIVGILAPTDPDRRYLLSAVDRAMQRPATFGDSTLDVATGTFRVGPLPGGTYSLLVQVRARKAGTWGVPVAGSIRFGPYELAHGQILDLGRIELPVPGSLDCQLVPVAGCEPKDVKVEWRDVGQRTWGLLTLGEDLDGSWAVVPGDYDVTIWGEGFLSIERRVTVLPPPAAATRLEAMLQPGQRLPLQLELPAGEERATFAVRAAGGRVAYDDEFGSDESRVVVRRPVLGLGSHTVVVVGESGRRYRGEFVVESLTPTRKALTFALLELR